MTSALTVKQPSLGGACRTSRRYSLAALTIPGEGWSALQREKVGLAVELAARDRAVLLTDRWSADCSGKGRRPLW